MGSRDDARKSPKKEKNRRRPEHNEWRTRGKDTGWNCSLKRRRGSNKKEKGREKDAGGGGQGKKEGRTFLSVHGVSPNQFACGSLRIASDLTQEKP